MVNSKMCAYSARHIQKLIKVALYVFKFLILKLVINYVNEFVLLLFRLSDKQHLFLKNCHLKLGGCGLSVRPRGKGAVKLELLAMQG